MKSGKPKLHKAIFFLLLLASLLLSMTVPALAVTTDTLVQCSSAGTVTNHTAIASVSLPVTFNASSDYYSTVDVAVYTGGSAVYQLTNLIPGTDGKVTISLGAVSKYQADTVYEIQYRGHYYVYGEDTQIIDNWQSSGLYFKVEAASVTGAALSSGSGTFDKYAPADVQTTITWNDATTVTGITANSTSIGTGNYSVTAVNSSTAALTIKKGYLATQSTGDLTLTVAFDQGGSATLTIKITDSNTPSTVATLSSLKAGGSAVSGFDPAVTKYDVELPYGTQPGSTAATVGATASDSKAAAVITQATALPGSATITVTAEDKTTTKVYTVNFTIGAAPTVPVSNIAVTGAGGAGGVAVGNTLQMSAAVSPGDATNKSVTWSVSNGTGSATIGTTGILSATGAGTVTAKATAADGSGVYGEKEITVTSGSGSGSSGGSSESGTTTTTVSSAVTGSTGADGVSSASVTQKQMQDALASAVKESTVQGTKMAVEFKVSTNSKATGISFTIPQTSFDTISDSKAGSLTISSPLASVTLDDTALSTIKAAADGDVTLTIKPADTSRLSAAAQAEIGGRPVYDLSITSGSTAVSKFGGGMATVSVPYTLGSGEDASKVVIYYISESGELTKVTDCVYDPATKSVRFVTTHFSKYAVGYSDVKFGDVSDWYADSVNYLAARDIISGTGNGIFSPNANITRAQFVTILAKLSGSDLTGFTASAFTDVSASDWYFSAAQWAYKNGVAAGTGGRFDPNTTITRQDMAAMIARYAEKVAKYELPETAAAAAFKDSGEIASYASAAVTSMQRAEIINGNSDGSFAPKANATRAAAAKMIAALLQGMIAK